MKVTDRNLSDGPRPNKCPTTLTNVSARVDLGIRLPIVPAVAE